MPAPKLSKRAEWGTRQKIGYLMQQGVDYPDCLSLAAGLVDYATLPVDLVKEVAGEILSDPPRGRMALQYGTTPGSLQLRQLLLNYLAELDETTPEEMGASLDQVVVTTGSQQCLDFVGQTVLNPGEICLVTAPSYFVYLSTLEGIGAEVVAVECDELGIVPASLEETLQSLEAAGRLPDVKLLYLVSYFDNPRGITMPTGRRVEVLRILKDWSSRQFIYLLEDAAYRELWFHEPPPPSMFSLDAGREHVIYTQTFSKSLSPGLRTGFGVLPKQLIKPVTDLKSIHDFGSPHLSQQMIAELIASGRYQKHVAELRQAYREKAEAMWTAMEATILKRPDASAQSPTGGLYTWLTIDSEAIDTRFEGNLFSIAAETYKMMYVPGELFYPSLEHPDATKTMRLSYGVQPIDKLPEGIERLSQAIEEVKQ